MIFPAMDLQAEHEQEMQDQANAGGGDDQGS